MGRVHDGVADGSGHRRRRLRGARTQCAARIARRDARRRREAASRHAARTAAGRARNVAVAVRPRGRAGAARVAVCVLASGDPMLFGVGATLARRLSPDEWRVLPAPSSLSLAAARLGWRCRMSARSRSSAGRWRRSRVTCCRAPPVRAERRRTHAGRVAAELVARGFGPTRISVFEHLGGPLERRLDGLAQDWRIDETARSTWSHSTASPAPTRRAARSRPACRTMRTVTTASSPSATCAR
ncbi:cobalt-precorrin-7 (C(5))-methyltransferase [Burkholderia sp. HI4860]|uniref:SAM-dependent methyltransferase n=1 Tax=Burkholderia sp. HI4860 TaxID=2015361 RepID=UPI001F608B90|nr:cobalt-precorrin-7 (C(5))-methyltransferase [Burkholderia sp. HI4860]MCI3970358.1 cobalt-precorrin-7 (C(5))-methyltransferase [Burkholderia sp. HI4860]